MAVLYTWSISTTIRNLSDGGITKIHWRCDGVDGDYSVGSYGATIHTPDTSAEGFIAYDNVTEANCIAWVQAQVGKDDVEAEIAAKIESQKNPTTSAGVPWSTT